jgi:hypothetical protein
MKCLLAATALVALAGCNGAAQFSPSHGSPATQPYAAFQFGHLYIAQGVDIASRVYRFALRADGLPATKPDGELSLDFRYPGSIAIGPDGDLYVSASGNANACKNERKCVVEIFAPGASGRAHPIRVLYVPQQPQYIAVDQRGYLDVSTLQGGGRVTNVYRPNASGHDEPVDQLTSDGVEALAANRGTVYIQTIAQGVEGVREHSSGHQPVYFTYGHNYASSGVATDTRHLYAQFFYLQRRTFLLATAIYRLDRPGAPIRTLIGTGCKTSFSGGALGYGLAVYKKYLFEGCIGLDGPAGGVLVYDSTKSGKQAPLELLPGGDAGVAVGP